MGLKEAISDCFIQTEVEYVVVYQANWLQSFLNDLMVKIDEPVKLQIDDKSTINLAKNPVSHGKRKDVETITPRFFV